MAPLFKLPSLSKRFSCTTAKMVCSLRRRTIQQTSFQPDSNRGMMQQYLLTPFQYLASMYRWIWIDRASRRSIRSDFSTTRIKTSLDQHLLTTTQTCSYLKAMWTLRPTIQFSLRLPRLTTTFMLSMKTCRRLVDLEKLQQLNATYTTKY